MFGGVGCPTEGFSELAPLNPRSPYAISKVAAFQATKMYRDAYGIFASSSICFNHSSPRRGIDFATRKITKGIADIKLGKAKTLKMGNLKPFRDESHAKDIVRGMVSILDHSTAKDFVLASGEGASIEQMFKYVCELAELNFEDVFEQDIRFMRPSDVPYLKGDASKARLLLDWQPTYTWKDLLKEMYLNDLRG